MISVPSVISDFVFDFSSLCLCASVVKSLPNFPHSHLSIHLHRCVNLGKCEESRSLCSACWRVWRQPGIGALLVSPWWICKLQEHDLADYRGKIVLLALIQSTCPHCAAFAENLQAVQERFADRVQVLAVVTPPDTPDKVKEFIGGHKITFPILLDTGQMSYSYILSADLKFPRLYMIDATGTIKSDYEYQPPDEGNLRRNWALRPPSAA